MIGMDLLVRGRVWRLLAVDAVGRELPPSGDPAWAELDHHIRFTVWRACRAIPLIVLGMDVLGWSTDFVLVADDPVTHRALTVMRAGAAPICLAMFASFHFTTLARRRPLAVSAPFALTLVAFAAFQLGSLGGVERQLFDFLMFALVPTVMAPAPIVARIGYVSAMAAAMSLGFFAPYGHWSHPFAAATVAFLASIAAMLIVIGHIVYVGACRAFFQEREIERTAAELKALSDSLEGQVQEKTVELRRLYEHLQLVREDERARLSRELHDELGQQLSAIGYVLATAKVRSDRDPASTRRSLDEVSSLLQRASETTRDIARELRPPLLEQYGFVSACEWMARKVTDHLRLECAFESAQDGPECPEPVAVAVYRVLQEALTNVGRHAMATKVRVELRSDASAVELRVTDDGRGLPPDGELGDGLGLVGMEQRMLGLGGTFSVTSGAEGGAVVHARVPMAARSAA